MQNRYLIILFIVLKLSCSAVYAQYSGGSGTSGDPYQIATTDDLIDLSSSSSDWSKYFVQTSNITFDEDETSVDWNGDGNLSDPNGFSPIGNSTTKFTGSYDGKGYRITNLYIDLNSSSFGGLFGYTRDALITGVNVRSIEIINV